MGWSLVEDTIGLRRICQGWVRHQNSEANDYDMDFKYLWGFNCRYKLVNQVVNSFDDCYCRLVELAGWKVYCLRSKLHTSRNLQLRSDPRHVD